MATIQWDQIGDRRYEYGVDRGVLYPSGSVGVPWNGLTAVHEEPSGGDIESYYIDGIKYLDVHTTEDFKATIEAFTYPDEFTSCDGVEPLGNGLIATQQRRKRFGFSYRTKIANDVLADDLGYKIHIVLNAMVAPTSRQNQTVSDNVDPLNFSWPISTRPDVVRGYKQTSHFIIDSRSTPTELLEQIEDILYGTEEEDPRIPSGGELIYLVTSYLSTIYDAGFIEDPIYAVLDAGGPDDPVITTIDAGGP